MKEEKDPAIVLPKSDDLGKIADCHQLAFPGALSAAMGRTYLKKMFQWYLTDSRAFLLMLCVEDLCVGYCGGLKVDGSTHVGSASSMIQFTFWPAVKTMLMRPWLLVHPEFLRKYRLVGRNIVMRIRKIFGARRPPETKNKKAAQPSTGLIVIGVRADMQNKGYGTLLLKAFENKTRELGFNRMSLTVNTNNTQAIRAYSRNGWKITDVVGLSTTMEKSL